MAGFASRSHARGWCREIAALAFVLPAFGVAQGADGPAILVATHDPALLSALDAAFAPRGVRVAVADRPLRAASDDLGTGAHAADLVWLCDFAGGTALCVRPHQGTVIIRRIAMATPLSPEDAAALALSVQVALMAETPTPDTVARSASSPEPARAGGVANRDMHSLTLELGGGARGGTDGPTFRVSVAGVFAPGWLGHHLGFGAAVATGSVNSNTSSSVATLSPGPSGPSSAPAGDSTLRLFARGQARVAPIWLQLDLGPELHSASRVVDGPTLGDEQRGHWSLDGFVGAVVPFGHFFAGARVGGGYLLTRRGMPANPFGGAWSGEVLATVGVGWF